MLGATDPEQRYYGCCVCLARVTTSASLATCPECGDRVWNLAVARE